MFASMDKLLEELKNCDNRTVYAVRLIKGKENFSLCLPSDKNNASEIIINNILSELEKYKDETISLTSQQNGIQADNLLDNEIYKNICNSFQEPYAREFKTCKNELLDTNYLVERIKSDNKSFMLIKRHACYKKMNVTNNIAFMMSKSSLKIEEIEKIYIVDSDVDVIIDEAEKIVYSMKGLSGFKTINHSESIKNTVHKNISEIQNWPFLSNAEFIDEKKLSYKYVYEKLYVALSNPTYLKQINESDINKVKKNIQTNYPKLKDESNFDENGKIKLNDNNLHDFMNVIGKGLKYNFFIGQAEDE